MISTCLFLCCVLLCASRFGSESNAQELYSFRQLDDRLQIYYSDNGVINDAMYYNIRDRGFDYREGFVACRNFSNEIMVDYERVSNDNEISSIELNCDNLPELTENCNFNFDDGNVIQLTCLESSGYSEGDILQLEDGRLIQLKVFDTDKFIWGHFCYQDNLNWNMNVADLACRSLGFDRVKDGMENYMREIDKRAYGLVSIDCTGASNFLECMSSPRTDNNRRCDKNEVIAITCENVLQTSTQIPLESTMTSSFVNTPIASQSPIPTSSDIPEIIQQSTFTSNLPEINQQSTFTSNLPEIIQQSTFSSNLPETIQQSSIHMSSSPTAPPPEQITSVRPTTPITLNTAENNLAKLIAIVATALVVILLLLVIGLVIVVCIILVNNRKKAKMVKENSFDEEGDGHQNESVTYANISTEQMPNSREEGLYNSITNSIQNGNVSAMNPFRETELYFEMPIYVGEDIYSSMIYECDKVVPNTDSRKYYNINKTTGQTNESLYLEPSAELPCFVYQNDAMFWEPGDTENRIYAQMSEKRYREVDPTLLTKDKVLGQGNFGIVYSGLWNSRNGEIPVAIKSLKVENKETNLSFLQEAAILGQFNHPNVLKLLGVVTLSKPYMMVTELLISGLKDQLNKVRKSGKTNIIPLGNVLARFTTDIALGMQYLAGKRFVHRDLAARNVLVNQTLSCKVGDFGLARMAEDNDYYMSSGGLIPLRWTAPEAVFYKKYSEKSDVWSYGITLYEVWSVGRAPWVNFTTDEVSYYSMWLQVGARGIIYTLQYSLDY